MCISYRSYALKHKDLAFRLSPLPNACAGSHSVPSGILRTCPFRPKPQFSDLPRLAFPLVFHNQVFATVANSEVNAAFVFCYRFSPSFNTTSSLVCRRLTAQEDQFQSCDESDDLLVPKACKAPRLLCAVFAGFPHLASMLFSQQLLKGRPRLYPSPPHIRV